MDIKELEQELYDTTTRIESVKTALNILTDYLSVNINEQEKNKNEIMMIYWDFVRNKDNMLELVYILQDKLTTATQEQYNIFKKIYKEV